MMFLAPLLIAFLISYILTPYVKNFAIKINAIDLPGERKVHTAPIARLGGIAIFAAFLVTILIYLPPSRRLIALLLGATVLLVVGVMDDIKGLNPWVKLFWQFVAAAIVLAGGIGITTITGPFGGVVDLSYGRFAVELLGFNFHIMPIANALSLLWMVGLINVVNFLDGLDGLACGVSAIAATVIFFLSVRPDINQPEVALIAIIIAGAALGFLPHNFFPAKIFMGDSGAYFLGLSLALLAIYSGAKLATAGLVLGFAIFDGVWAAVRRTYKGVSPFKADKHHFHHLLLDAGLTQKQSVLTLYAISLLFGLTAVFLDSPAKLVMLGVLFVFMSAATAFLTFYPRLLSKRKKTS